MRGLLIDPETGDVQVTAGRLAVGDTTAQTAECVLRAVRGEFKEHPLIGAEILKMLGGSPNPMWKADAKTMLQACGLSVSRVEMKDGQITIEYNGENSTIG